MYTAINGVVTHVSDDGEVSAKAPLVVTCRAPYAYDADAASDAAGLFCADATLAKQSFKDECDINVLVERFGLGATIPAGLRLPTYGDFTGVSDFHTAANAIAKANESFAALPASVRWRFENDPGQFVAFCSDEKNLPELRKMGLATTPPDPVIPAPIAVKVVSEGPVPPVA